VDRGLFKTWVVDNIDERNLQAGIRTKYGFAMKNGNVSKISCTGIRAGIETSNVRLSSQSTSFITMIRLLGWILRLILLDLSLVVLFALFIFSVLLHKIHDDFLYPQLQLMYFERDNRQFTDTTYYHRYCTGDDFTATSHLELIIQDNFTTEDSVQHMLTHGASIYPDLLTNKTAFELREWISRENKIRDGWNVIESQNRYTWGININMHPMLQTFWKELASNEKLLNGLQAIVGPDPAIIEFTAITSSYGAQDQYIHADVVPDGSAVKFARSFVPSYSLFVPLQDTTYEMGATHVLPGSHLCSDGAGDHGDDYTLAMSGKDGVWSMGSGALLNQQTFHKGMGFTQEGAQDRVVLIATFAPRPNFRNGVETRMIGQGGSYSLLWDQWGHTFSDYVHADKRMTEPQKTLRSLGLIKGNGWTFVSSLSMRIANEDTEMTSDDLEHFIEKDQGFSFLPQSWQTNIDEESSISEWHAFLFGLLKKGESELNRIYLVALCAYISGIIILTIAQRTLGLSKKRKETILYVTLRIFCQLVTTHGLVVILAWLALIVVEDSNWAKSINARKAYRIPVADIDNPPPSTIPYRMDILFAPHYTSDYFASYSRILDFAHPGNAYWKEITNKYSSSYATLSTDLQKRFCDTLIDWVTIERRFLKQDEERFWTLVDDEDELAKFCHRELVISFNPMLETMLRQIDSLQSETKFGRFRETSMQANIIPKYIQSWDYHLLLSLKNREVEKKSKGIKKQLFATTSEQIQPTSFNRVIYSQVRVGSLSINRFSMLPFQSRSLPPMPSRMEPYEGVWLQEGDKAMALFRCDHERNGNGWFSGTITAAIPNEATFDIMYDDGDTDEALADDCVDRLYRDP